MTAEELEVAIQTRDRPLVIDFYATWCGPCLLLAKELEQVSVLLNTSYVIQMSSVRKSQSFSHTVCTHFRLWASLAGL